MTVRVLLVSIAFPPKGDPECIQTGRYCHYLQKDPKIVIDVVTSRRPTLFMPTDQSLEKYAHVNGQLIEIPLLESKYTNFLIRKLAPAILARPDSKMTFHWQWKKVVRQLADKPDVIYSRSYPLSSSLMALKLSRFFQVPWVMHLSDPWTENALHQRTQPELEYNGNIEAKCFQHAAAISFTSEKTVNLYRKKYPQWATKLKVFPNVYDPDDVLVEETPLRNQGVARIVYTGGLANTRSALPFIEALKRLASRVQSIETRLEVVFAGDMDRANRDVFARTSLPFLKHVGVISADKARQLQLSADLLVVIDSKINDPSKAVFFPSKLLDYSILKKPIMAITDSGSTTDEYLRNQGGNSFSHDSIDAMSDWLADFIQGKVDAARGIIDPFYAADVQAARLNFFLKSLI